MENPIEESTLVNHNRTTGRRSATNAAMTLGAPGMPTWFLGAFL